MDKPDITRKPFCNRMDARTQRYRSPAPDKANLIMLYLTRFWACLDQAMGAVVYTSDAKSLHRRL